MDILERRLGENFTQEERFFLCENNWYYWSYTGFALSFRKGLSSNFLSFKKDHSNIIGIDFNPDISEKQKELNILYMLEFFLAIKTILNYDKDIIYNTKINESEILYRNKIHYFIDQTGFELTMCLHNCSSYPRCVVFISDALGCLKLGSFPYDINDKEKFTTKLTTLTIYLRGLRSEYRYWSKKINC